MATKVKTRNRTALPPGARVAFAIGLSVAVLAGSPGTAAPYEVERCSATVCAIAGVKVSVICQRPDVKTVSCHGEVSVWGTGRSNTAAFPGTLNWRAEGRCGGNCSGSELAHGATAWNGITESSKTVLKLLRFPPAHVSSSTRACIRYTLYGSSTASARSISPLQFGVDAVEATHNASVDTLACNQV